jgi:hypothetical protein
MAISSFASYHIKDIREAGLGVGPIKHAQQMYAVVNFFSLYALPADVLDDAVGTCSRIGLWRRV